MYRLSTYSNVKMGVDGIWTECYNIIYKFRECTSQEFILIDH